MPTAKGFIGQYGDAATGLDYLNARYYDPAVGQFTQADTVQGPNRYAYTDGNPETRADPSGRLYAIGAGGEGSDTTTTDSSYVCPSPTTSRGTSTTHNSGGNWLGNVAHSVWGFVSTAANVVFNLDEMGREYRTAFNDPNASLGARAWNGMLFAGNLFLDVTGVGELGRVGVGGVRLASDLVGRFGEAGGVTALKDIVTNLVAGCANSFAATTRVATPTGEVAIASVAVGSLVVAYDPHTEKRVPERVEHLFINHDANLLDVTLRPEAKSKRTQQAQPSEMLHTTSEHPFLTTDRGFVAAILLHIGEHVQRGDGSTGIVVALRVVSGTAVRYNLTVQELHTYLVGSDRWVVHNCGIANIINTKAKIAATKIYNAITGHLGADDLVGYVRDIAGDPVLKASGDTYNHAREVESALTGLPKQIALLEKLRDAQGVLSDADRCIVECVINNAQQAFTMAQDYILSPTGPAPTIMREIHLWL